MLGGKDLVAGWAVEEMLTLQMNSTSSLSMSLTASMLTVFKK